MNKCLVSLSVRDFYSYFKSSLALLIKIYLFTPQIKFPWASRPVSTAETSNTTGPSKHQPLSITLRRKAKSHLKKINKAVPVKTVDRPVMTDKRLRREMKKAAAKNAKKAKKEEKRHQMNVEDEDGDYEDI
jgi:hypothetical protein